MGLHTVLLGVLYPVLLDRLQVGTGVFRLVQHRQNDDWRASRWSVLLVGRMSAVWFGDEVQKCEKRKSSQRDDLESTPP